MNDWELSFKKKLERIFPEKNTEYNEAIHYALFPTGKLFRPKLFLTLCRDFHYSDENSLNYFAYFLESHHAYTLVHDDLPCMDNDEYRRGKLAVHAKYGEWQAVLVGDALLNLSYQFLSRIKHPRFNELLQLVTWAMGGKGLIRGQFEDLSEKSQMTFEQLIRIHELKTARLIQLCLLGAYILSDQKDYQLYKDLWKLGTYMGLTFQLLDDFDDFKAGQNSNETGFNLFQVDAEKSKTLLKNLVLKMNMLSGKREFKHLRLFIEQHY
ncbi:MAG: polyprenyl synthetase family protein [Halobacteriovoraceae bacterium]|nr:polyprenyl synthetase family protein [Halobacteriovoraceae bacterium]MCB9093944.1 polyprenyl synthetase family protein [Halobacteriovoraceae bacterium]